MATTRARRLDITDLVAGQLLPSGKPVRIRDIAFGGFAMETNFPVEQGAKLGFRFRSKDGSSFELSARVVHTSPAVGPESPLVFVTGLEFAEQLRPVATEITEALVQQVNWILSFHAAADKP